MHAQKHTHSIALAYSGVLLPDSAGLGFSANGRRRINCNHPSHFARKIQEQHYWYSRSIHILKHRHTFRLYVPSREFCPLFTSLNFFYEITSKSKTVRNVRSCSSFIQCSHKCEIMTFRSNNCSYCCDNCTLSKVTD